MIVGGKMIDREPWFEDSREDVRKIVNNAVDAFEIHVGPLFRFDDETGGPDHEGTAIFARFQGGYFLISAGHALRACLTGLAVPDAQGHLLWIEGGLTVSTPSGGHRTELLDIGIVELSDGEVSRIGEERFLELTLDGLDAAELWTAPVVTVLGFPVRDTTSNRGEGTISGALTQFTTGFLPDAEYARAEVDLRYHILLRYRREAIKTSRSVGAPPSWVGISGGGAWLVPIAPMEREEPPRLIGVVLGHPSGYRKALQVTRIEAVYHFLRLHDSA